MDIPIPAFKKTVNIAIYSVEIFGFKSCYWDCPNGYWVDDNTYKRVEEEPVLNEEVSDFSRFRYLYEPKKPNP